MDGFGKIAVVGGGVIGGGWAARFLLNGCDVALYDPHPEARRVMVDILANARRAHTRLFGSAAGAEGRLTHCDTLNDAVAGADYVQESVPEQLGLKRHVYGEIEQAAPATAVIASSTSGFMPSDLANGLAHPERLVVAHPFNPVYLLPLVEVVGGLQTDPACLERVWDFYIALGMKPLRVHTEIDAHIADRLLEAVWREALWLVRDGIATTAEIDDAIRFGFGLRWAQMGLFETYRIAGGEPGMRHFLKQFGPALHWPWSRLTDVPEMTDALIELIAEQSDAQSGSYSIRELERIRDDNLVAILKALEAGDWGAGTTVKAARARAEARLADGGRAPPSDGAAATQHSAAVLPDWLDYNGHMTEHRYLQVFGDATDVFLAAIGIDAAYLADGHSVYTVETHIRYLAEVAGGAALTVRTTVLGHDDRRIRLLHQMRDDTGRDVATAEHMLLHVDTRAQAAVPMGAPLGERVATLARIPPPRAAAAFAGRGIRDIARGGQAP
ncbi:MAG: carnitine 3-dehydrogenase [Rhodospirillaceae bacterium]|nr:carnitine 3-dehydrogenase [Rhodospirillaceae bacterium]